MNKFLTIIAFAAATAGAGAVPAIAQTGAMPTCAAGDPVVWENSKSKAYHLQGDSYFGKTKHGSYACKSAADSAGYHVAGSKSHKHAKSGSTTPPTMTSPAPAAT